MVALEAGAGPLVVGRYAVCHEIASGGMATVYLGRFMGPAGFSRPVAVKRLHPQFAKDPEFVSMLLDEARLAARIRHPNVVAMLDVVVQQNEVFLAMEYVAGQGLSRLLRAAPLRGERVPMPIVLRIATDVLQGLQAAHEARDESGTPLHLVHRDVSPQNILVGADGVARLLDFGVAKAAGRTRTTEEGKIKGKLAYMAPEQLAGHGVTQRTDLYAFAVVLWELVTAQRLFVGDNELDLVAKLLNPKIRPPRELAPECPPELERVIMRGLRSEPSERFATARDMCLALEACGPTANAITVGEWVQALAGPDLEARAAKVTALEKDVIAPGEHSLPSTVVERPTSGGTGVTHGAHAATAGSSISRAVDAMRSKGSRVVTATLLAVLAVALVGAGVFAAGRRVNSLPPVPAQASNPAPSTVGPQASASDDTATQPASSIASAAPAVSYAATVVAPASVRPGARSAPASPARHGPAPSRAASGATSAGASNKPCTIVSYIDSVGITHFREDCK